MAGGKDGAGFADAEAGLKARSLRLWQSGKRAPDRAPRSPHCQASLHVPSAHRHGAPALGGQTREILAEAGYAPAEIDTLFAAGAAMESPADDEDAA